MKERFKKILITILLLTFTFSVGVSSTLEERLVEATVKKYALDTQQYEIEVLSVRLELTDPGKIEFTLKEITQKEPLGLFTVYATATENGEVVSSGQVRMRIRKFDTILVATDKIERHGLLTSDNTIMQRCEITTLREQPVTSLSQLTGSRSKKIIKKGDMLTSANIEEIPEVERGDVTTIIFDSGIFQITAEGIAMESGRTGKSIRVKNSATNKIITAVITGAGEVRVE